MEAAVEISDGGEPTSVSSRRSIQPRQRREINVRKAIGIEDTVVTNGESKPASKPPSFTPLLYIPARERRAAEQAAAAAAAQAAQNTPGGLGYMSPYGAQYGASPGYGSYGSAAGAVDIYGGRTSALQAPASDSALTTSRGEFRLRPRRNIRVKSIDELEAEDGNEKPPEVKQVTAMQETSNYSTGFVRDTGSNQSDRLARRGRQSIHDMLGRSSASSYVSPAPQSRYETQQLGVPALEAPPQFREYSSPYHSEINAPSGQYSMGVDEYSVNPYHDLERYPPVGSEVMEMDETPPPLVKPSLEERLTKMGIGQTGIKNEIEAPKSITDDSDIELFTGKTYDVDSVHSSTALQLQPTVNLGFTPSLAGYSDQLALLRERILSNQKPAGDCAPQEETLDQKKARILGSLYQSKIDQANSKTPSMYESLEDKKARIYANLQRKYNNLEPADLLGLTSTGRAPGISPDLLELGSSSRRPGVYMRSKSLGDNLEPRTNDYNGATTYIPMEGDLHGGVDHTSRHPVVSNHPTSSYAWAEPEVVQPRYAQGVASYGHLDRVSNGHSELFHQQREDYRSPGDRHREDYRSQGGQQREDYRSPGDQHREDYRSPGDRQREDYRSPGDRQREDYRSPGDRQREDYRSPGDRQREDYRSPGDRQREDYRSPGDRQREDYRSPGESPVEEVLSVDSGYQGRTGPDLIKEDSPDVSRSEIEHSNMSSKEEESSLKVAPIGAPKKKTPPPVPVKKSTVPRNGEARTVTDSKPVQKKIIIIKKGGEVDEASVKKSTDTNRDQKKQAPPTRPKPRPKSAPPSKSKSVTNLFDGTLSPRRERRSSTLSVAPDDDDHFEVTTRDRRASSVQESNMQDSSHPFSRNSRLRSSTKAWEMRQAENMAKIRAQAQNRSGSTTPTRGTGRQTPVKKPAGVVTGRVSLSEDSPAKEKPIHTPRNVETYDKPWRSGSALAKSSTSTVYPAKVPPKPTETKTPSRTPRDGNSVSSSRTGSPPLPGTSGRPPKNPVKERGSVEQGFPRSPPSLALENSPSQNTTNAWNNSIVQDINPQSQALEDSPSQNTTDARNNSLAQDINPQSLALEDSPSQNTTDAENCSLVQNVSPSLNTTEAENGSVEQVDSRSATDSENFIQEQKPNLGFQKGTTETQLDNLEKLRPPLSTVKAKAQFEDQNLDFIPEKHLDVVTLMSDVPKITHSPESGSEKKYVTRAQLIISSPSMPSAEPTKPNTIKQTKSKKSSSRRRTSSPSKPAPRKVTTPKPFNFSYIPRRRRGSVSSDGTDVSLDDFLSLEADFNSQEDDNISDISNITSNLRQLADNWNNEASGSLPVMSPDSAVFSQAPSDSRPMSPGSLGSVELLDDITPPFVLRNMKSEDYNQPREKNEKMESFRERFIQRNNEHCDLETSKDEPDFARPVGVPKGSKRFSSTASASSGSSTLGRKSSTSGKSTATTSATPKRKRVPMATTSARAGAVDEEFFIKSFEDVPKVHIFSARELTDRLTKDKETLSDANNDWEKRVDALKDIRAVMIAGGASYDEFTQLLRQMEPSIVLSAKDLRSQVVREACITISYMAQQLANKFDHLAEVILPPLINLIPNSVKIMATSGIVCIRFIIQYTHATRLIPIITGGVSSKSNVIRKTCYEVLDQLLHTWPTQSLERHIAVLQDAIKRGLTDADPDARQHSRKAFWGFAEHFREQADSLLNSLDASKQKMLQGELSNSSSNNSLSGGGTAATRLPLSKTPKSRSRSMSSERTNQLYSRTLAGPNPPRRSALSKAAHTNEDSTDGAKKDSGIMRSSSAVDLSGSMGYRGVSSLPRATTPTQNHSSNYSSLRFRNLRQMKAYKRKDSAEGSAEDLRQLAASRPRTLSASDITVPQSVSPSRSSADLLSPDKYKRSVVSRHMRTTSNTQTSRPKKKPLPSSSSTAQSILSPERSRPRSRIGVSQSQPGSRSGSPTSRISYITHTQNNSSASSRARYGKSGIPRSQGASRETSPNRLAGYSRERRLSGSKLHTPAGRVKNGGTGVLTQHLLPQGNDAESILQEALSHGGPLRKRYESYDSDDNASETSSVCSERSFSSYSKTSEDMSEILSNLSSGSWADRKEGLIALQNLLRGNRLLNRLELKKITEIFTRMFHDPHGKVFSVFMETLIELIAAHRVELHDWLYVCLTRLLNKMGADLLGSVQVKVQRALEAVRDSFPYDHQFQILNRFIVDQTQTPNLKVKVAVMNYLHGLALLMDPSEFTNTSDTRLAVSRIITWTTEPKSVDVRKAAQAVLIALFNLNSPEFSMMLSVLPKTFQDGATRILHNHLRSASQDSEPLSPRNITSPPYSNRYRPSPNRSANIDDVDTENMNPEDIYNSIKKTSADIQNLSKLDSHYDDIKKERDSTSQDSGIQGSTHDIRGTSPDVKDGLVTRGRQYNPSYYQDDSVNGYNKAALAEAVFDVDNDMFNEGFNEDFSGDQSDIVADILKELSNHNQRSEERTSAMLSLIKITREGSKDVWDEHFKTILLMLLETLGDTDSHIRALALRVLREILRHQPGRFKEYAALTILKILEAHKDPVKEVSRAAEECATTLAHSIPADLCIQVLKPIIETAEYPVNLAGIKMETKVIEKADKEVVSGTLKDIIPGLLTGYDNKESPVRKASVFCLVALFLSVGEELKPYLQDLSGSKMKLLNLYIKRSLAEKGQSGPGLCSNETSKTTSPASTIADLALM